MFYGLAGLLVISLVAVQIERSSEVIRKVPGSSFILNTLEGFGNQVSHWISSWFSDPKGKNPANYPSLKRLSLVEMEAARPPQAVKLSWWEKLFSREEL